MHNDPPHTTDVAPVPVPAPYTATQVTHLIGGRLDGINVPIPQHCTEFYAHPCPTVQQLEDHYRYCPHASALFHKPCFIHATLQHDLYAR